MNERPKIQLSTEQMAMLASITESTSDPIIAYVRQDNLLPVDTDAIGAGETVSAIAIHKSGQVEGMLICGRPVSDGTPGEYWWKLMLSDLLAVLEDMSGKQTKALRTILDQFDPHTGIIQATQAELAERCGVSRTTLNSVMSIMMDHHLIMPVRRGQYAINPDFMSQGGAGTYRKLMYVYQKAEDKRLGKGGRLGECTVEG